MIDKRPASEYMEDAKKAITKLDDFNESHHISGKAFSSMIIVVLIIILCGVYIWQMKHPKAPEEAVVTEQTQETPASEETQPQTPADEAPAPDAPLEEPAEAPEGAEEAAETEEDQ